MWFDGTHMGWMGLSWLVSLGVLVLLIWFVVRLVSPSGPANVSQGDSPETILKRRYASGELTREEYQGRLEDLRR